MWRTLRVVRSAIEIYGMISVICGVVHAVTGTPDVDDTSSVASTAAPADESDNRSVSSTASQILSQQTATHMQWGPLPPLQIL